jgi:hypothetical protein
MMCSPAACGLAFLGVPSRKRLGNDAQAGDALGVTGTSLYPGT